MKTNIKRIIPAIAIAFSFGLFSSCTDDLTEKAYDFISPDGVGDSDAAADMWVIGTYNKIDDDMFRWFQFPRVLDFDCDYATGPDWAYGDLGAGNFQSSGGSGNLDAMWSAPYNIIHRANLSIKYIKAMQNVSEAQRNNDLGELYFLKAWSYFLLTRAYGEVPVFYVSVEEGADFNQPRQPILTVYEHIISLLKDAEDQMYKVGDPGFKEGRASSGSAASLLAKVYVTMASGALADAKVSVKGGPAYITQGNDKVRIPLPVSNTFTKEVVAGYESFDATEYFKLARDKAKEVIDGKYGTYDLIKTSYADIWSQGNKNKTEHIWSLQSKLGDAKFGNAISKWYTGLSTSANALEIADGQWAGCRVHWYELFESSDTRITEGVMHRWKKWGNWYYYPAKDSVKVNRGLAPYNDGNTYVLDQSSASLSFLTKYFYSSDRTQNNGDINYPFLRFADVLLIYAEAENEVNGPDQAAIDALNRVRTRSNASAKSVADFTTKEQLRSFILEERAREFACEGDRRWDLIRWGIYLQAMNAIGIDENDVVKYRERKHLLYPIPASEVIANKAFNGQNNPGWN